MDQSQKTLEIKLLDCLKCQHRWASRLEQPKMCPRCKRYDWNREKRERVYKPLGSKYPFATMQVGESVSIPMEFFQTTHEPNLRFVAKLKAAVAYQMTYNKDFYVTWDLRNFTVRRLK